VYLLVSQDSADALGIAFGIALVMIPCELFVAAVAEAQGMRVERDRHRNTVALTAQQ
jgi:hypothetical protein